MRMKVWNGWQVRRTETRALVMSLFLAFLHGHYATVGFDHWPRARRPALVNHPDARSLYSAKKAAECLLNRKKRCISSIGWRGALIQSSTQLARHEMIGVWKDAWAILRTAAELSGLAGSALAPSID
jgi:hypothetical protein